MKYKKNQAKRKKFSDKNGNPFGMKQSVFRNEVTFALTIEFILQVWPENVMIFQDQEFHLLVCFKNISYVNINDSEIYLLREIQGDFICSYFDNKVYKYKNMLKDIEQRRFVFKLFETDKVENRLMKSFLSIKDVLYGFDTIIHSYYSI